MEYCERPAEPDYDDPHQVRCVYDGGWITWKGHEYRVGRAFVGEPVAVRPTTDEVHLAVFWSTRCIARLDLLQRTSIFGRKLP